MTAAVGDPDDGAADRLPVAGPGVAGRAAARLLRREPRAAAATAVLAVLAAVAGLAAPWLVGQVVERVAAGDGVAAVDGPAALIILAAVLQLLLTRQARRAAGVFGERTAAHVREQFLDRVLRLPAAVVERVPTGDLAARATGDVTSVATALRDAVPDLFRAALQVLFVVVAVVLVDPVLGTCGLLAAAGVGLAVRWYVPRARAAYLASGAADSAFAEMLAATAAGARTVEALGLQERRVRVGLDAVDRCRRRRLRTLALRTVLFPLVDLSALLPLVAVLLVGGVRYAGSAEGLGTVVAAALYLRQLDAPLATLTLWIDQLQSCAASFARLEGLAALTRPRATTVPTAEPAGDRMVVAAVHHAYGGGPDVLRGVDLDLRPGERVAVVGPSGAGKSTLGRLLAGIDAPRSGRVTVGGVAVADLPSDRLRRQVVLVTQEGHVFRDPLRQNLVLARPDADDDALRGALAAVGADWVDDLPHGLDTELGDDAYRLDAVQAQQVALARVVLADPHTVVLDEATASLDATTARATERALAGVLAGRTVVAVAHRLHTAHDADRIVVLEEGRITESGTHDELVSSDGAYAALWRSWHGEGHDRGHDL